MNSPEYRVRRGTLDDIAPLTALWKLMGFPTEDLGRRVTEFQVAEGPDGKLLGALGLQIAERQGRVHGEAFTDFALAEQLRPILWERMQSLAVNHGLLRLWTQEQAPFWSRCGLVPADPETLQKLPAAWRGQSGNWLTLKLKEDLSAIISADKEFALFMATEKERTQRALHHARVLKGFATLLALAVLGLVIFGAIWLMRHSSFLMRK